MKNHTGFAPARAALRQPPKGGTPGFSSHSLENRDVRPQKPIFPYRNKGLTRLALFRLC